jgi:N-methylhydantoinase A/oxoprolinase/acetone carboxylase beta subunit
MAQCDLPQLQLMLAAGTLHSRGADRMDFTRYGRSGRPRMTGQELLETLPEIAAIARMAPAVDAFAVSAYFSVANAEHEVSLKALIAEVCNAPVVCGHELTQRVGMVERAVTATLNARLLPLVRELLDAVRDTLGGLGITAPLMVVKGDGSLMQERIARDRPVETVLSGPAASVIGACRLSGLTSAIVADMGGTTTDIALVAGSMPQVNPNGALVGGWRTRVQALDARTVGLGGDSRARVTRDDDVTVGPDRAIPLCVAAERFAEVRVALRRMVEAQAAAAESMPPEPLFVTLVRRPARELSSMTASLFDALDGAAVHIDELGLVAGEFVDIDEFVRSGAVAEIAFTPSDALAVLGELPLGDASASADGLVLLAARAGCAADKMLARVRAAVTDRLALEVAARALAADLMGCEPSAEVTSVLAHLLGDEARVLGAQLTLGVPLVAVGAPAAAWFPGANERLGGKLVVPRHAEVANAFGALAGRVLEHAEARVKANPDETFAVITPALRETFDDYPTARARAEQLATDNATAAALAAGAPSVTVALEHDEVVARQVRRDDDVIVELTVVATASGPPFLGEHVRDARQEEVLT